MSNIGRTGLYTYKYPFYKHASRAYMKYDMRVRVVAEKANKYQVQYLGFHASGAAVNSRHWVRKDMVKLDVVYEGGAAIATVTATTQDGRLKFNVSNIRLPYKDNDDDNEPTI